LCGVESQLGTIEVGKLANLTVVEGGSYFDSEAKVREVWIDGRIYRALGEEPKVGKPDEPKVTKAASPEEGAPAKPKEELEKKPAPNSTTAKTEKKDTAATPEKPSDEKKDRKKEQVRELQKTRVARSPLEGRGVLAEPASVLIRNVTIW